MYSENIYNDLIAFHLGRPKPAIFWLRLFKSGAQTDESVAIVTEVPGNPSFSVTNCISRITKEIADRFSIVPSALIVFEIYPKGAFSNYTSSVNRVEFSPTRWNESSRIEIEIEEIIGCSLSILPDHEELYSRVIELGGGNIQKKMRPLFQAIQVEDLPPPHNPSSCVHIERFRGLQKETQFQNMTRAESEIEIGNRFLASITKDDIRACVYYHDADWLRIANESVRIIETVGRSDAKNYVEEARHSSLAEADQRWSISLFSDPVFIGGGGYTNGQHRACALRFSGADRAAIAVDNEFVGFENQDWVYEGNG